MRKRISSNRWILAIAFLGVTLWVLFNHKVHVVHAVTSATISIWNITVPIGHNPDAAIEDIAGLTGHVNTTANPLTIVAVIDNSNNPQGPCGVLFMNPATNMFVDYGLGGGFADGVDINLTAPKLTGPTGGPTFQPGDTWGGIAFGSPPLFVNLKGSNNFRFYTVGSGGVRGVKVDQSSGMIFFTDTSGTINRLDPSSNTVTTWTVGGVPYYLTMDGSGNVFAAVATAKVAGGADAIVELAPGTGGFKAWAVPGGGLAPGVVGLAANGIAQDSAGNIWVADSASNEVGRLNPTTNEFCKFTQAGVTAHPQQIASTGSGSTLQAFWTEAGAGEGGTDLRGAVSVLTQSSAVPETSPCPTPAPTTGTLPSSTSTAAFTDSIRTPRTNTITPLVTTVNSTSSNGIDRFPMPLPTGGTSTAPNAPSGMTGVAMPNTVFGSYQDTSFTNNSAMFEVSSPVIIAPPPSTTQTQTQTLGAAGTTTTYTFPTPNGQNYTYKITPTDNAGGESLTITAFAIPQSACPTFNNVTNKITGFVGNETGIPYGGYSTPECVEFQATCTTTTGGTTPCNFHYTVATGFDLPTTTTTINNPDFVVVHGANCPLTPTSPVVSIFKAYLADKDPTDVADSLGPSCFEATYVPGSTPTTPFNTYLVGFFPPIGNQPTVNDAEAGQGLPILFQANSAAGSITPTTTSPGALSPGLTYCDPTTTACGAGTVTIQFFQISCGTLPPPSMTIAAAAAGASGLQFNGATATPPNAWQLNAKPPKSFAGTCQRLEVALPTGSSAPAPKLKADFSFH